MQWTQHRSPPGQRAPSASTSPGTVVYAIGDIHGRIDLLDAIHQGIEQDAKLRPARRRLLVYLGDYISRGPDSRAVVDRVIGWRPQGGTRGVAQNFDVVALKGNHEELLLRFLDGDLFVGRHWLGYGGADTLAHYGGPLGDPRSCDADALAAARARLSAAMPREHRAFLRGLVTSHREGDYFFAHAGILPGVPLEGQSDRDLVWIRNRFLRSDADHGAVVVHGHCIAAEPEVRHNRIGIDTGAYDSGVLTCLVLDGAERSFLQTGPSIRNGPAEARGAVCPDSSQ
ncbi:serine/threonine protein phosphatase [Aromatoleum diolicum]|uniref:Serine/threonine protein phosphatase n=1 Tax=Aromatoleum diolicum TaxID=75796 RepID=A0ABX1QCE7_9RHOO|nr:metallophosphoesterase [Aromatoleum diolicum]NMG75162.1 serine/threonine protein phosphatase [Aromatoleum diolicum]